MAEPRNFSGQNNVLAAPKGMEKNCGSLPVHFTGHSFISCWQLSDDEKKIVADTGMIWLHLAGEGHPPVMLTAAPMMEQRDSKGVVQPYDVEKGLAESLAICEQAQWQDRFIKALIRMIRARGGDETPELVRTCIDHSATAWNHRNPDMTPEQIAQAEYAVMFPPVAVPASCPRKITMN